METCLETGNAPSVYLIEEATGSKPVAPILPLLRNATLLSKIELSAQSKKNGLFLRRLKESRTKPTRIVTNLSPNISGRVAPCRWQQQHRTCPRIGHRFDQLVS